MLGAGISMGVVPDFDRSPGVERWGTNAVMFRRYGGDFNEWTRWFDLHRPAHIQKQRPEAYAWYTEQDGARPIYHWEPDPAIPGSVAYPIDTVRAFFGSDTHDERDFWGSLSWMFALAIVEGFTDIDLFWFVVDTHCHEKQIPSVRYWIGQARGRGLNVTIHGDSSLKPNHPLYGFQTT